MAPRARRLGRRLLHRALRARPGRGRQLPRRDQGRRRVVPEEASAPSPPASSTPAPTSGRSWRPPSCPAIALSYSAGTGPSSWPALVGFVWLLLLVPALRRARRSTSGCRRRSSTYIRSDPAEAAVASADGLSLRALPRRPGPSSLGKFMTDPVWWFFLYLAARLLQRRTHGLSIKHSWVHLVTIYLDRDVCSASPAAGCPGTLIRRGWSVNRARKTAMFVFALCVLPILVGDAGRRLAGGRSRSASPARRTRPGRRTCFTTVSDMFPKKDVGLRRRPRRHGRGGRRACCSRWLTGWLLDSFKAGGRRDRAVTRSCSASARSPTCVSFAIHHLLAPRLRADPGRATA